MAGSVGTGLRRAGGTVTVKDSILWGNGVDSAGTVSFSYSNVGTGGYGETPDQDGNISVNPLFVDTTYYHLQSRAGNYTGGYFSGGTWGRSSSNSPCLDAGDPYPGSAYAREPQPQGKRVNMGCYGNTEVAALSPVPQGTVIMFR